jgi:hypothetical protein
MWTRHTFAILVTAVAAACLAGGAPAADIRAKAEVSCRATAESLQYDCTIKLTDALTNAPLTGVTLMVGADMPSMPMAHNVRPVKAEAGAEPGTYRARLALEMAGVWALHLNIGGPLRDRVVKVMRFEDEHASPGPTPKGPSTDHKQKSM